MTLKVKHTVVIFQYVPNKMQLYTVYLYLENALHVSDGTTAYHQECIQLYLQHLVFILDFKLSPCLEYSMSFG
jgi:hypothetical protein